MKKILASIFGMGALVSMILAGAEKEDGSCDLLWSLSCMVIAVICGWLFNKLTKKCKA